MMKFMLLISILLGLFVIGLWQVGNNRPLQPIDVTVRLWDYGIDMIPRTVPSYAPLRFSFVNQGVIDHAIVMEKAGEINRPLDQGGSFTTIGVIPPGHKYTSIWTIKEPGQYQIACHLPGHYEGGMVKLFKVTALGDFIYGQPTPPVRLLAAFALFAFLEGSVLILYRRWETSQAILPGTVIR